MDEASWLALTAALTAIGGAWTWYAFRHRGLALALRGAGLTLLVPALYLTDTLEVVVDIGAEVAAWATRLVFSPTVWLGIVLGGIAVVLLGTSSVLRSRELARSEEPEQRSLRGRSRKEVEPGPATGRGAGKASGTGDAELDEIEELLRRRGIT